ncbi:AAA family ATPase [Dyella flagellata]|uniref:ATPase AAA-type core domain-containing protein n=2 Tax=Dyella flagellata TaxID=1867833 RepID=A0ABQ5X589_9GAMM|nr:hypothetical protein GCM10007898_03510 [Dyella flagellata]
MRRLGCQSQRSLQHRDAGTGILRCPSFSGSHSRIDQIYVDAVSERFVIPAKAGMTSKTLRYLLWIAALDTPRPPSLMVLNEPGISLHPDLLPALARLIGQATAKSQVGVISHASRLIAALEDLPATPSRWRKN